MSVTAVDQSFRFQTSDHLSADISTDWRKEPKAEGGKELTMFAEEEPSFWDFLDVINPLQHIPIVNTFYREMTGDQIGVGARLAGGTLFGGPIGLVASAVNCMIEEDTGKDVGGHVLALFDDDAAPKPAGETPPVQVAATPQAPPVAAPQAAAADISANSAFKPNLGETDALNSSGATMLSFGADGEMLAGPARPPQIQAVPQMAAATAPMPLLNQPAGRFMPVPGRNPGINAVNSPPPVSIPISNSGTRSNVPITGRDPVARAPSPVAVQRALESTGHQSAAPSQLPGKNPESQDWFVGAMKTGLDKYEQAAKLNRAGEAAPVPLQ